MEKFIFGNDLLEDGGTIESEESSSSSSSSEDEEDEKENEKEKDPDDKDPEDKLGKSFWGENFTKAKKRKAAWSDEDDDETL